MNTIVTKCPAPPMPLAPLPEWARLIQYPDGTLAAFAIRTVEGGQAVCAWYSVDGEAWDGPHTLVALRRDLGLWSGVEALIDRDGEAHLFLLNDLGTGVLGNPAGEEAHPEVAPGEHRLDIWRLRSRDGRQTWPHPERIWTGYTGALNSVLQLNSGRILLPFSYAVTRTWSDRGTGPDAFTFMGTFLCTVIYSDDHGATWQLSNALKVQTPDITYAYGAVEPVAVELKDGRVWMLIRTQLGRFYESFSADGAAWSTPEPTAIVSSDSPAGLARLADGRLALLWNCCLRHPYAYGGRQALHGAVSDDDGRTWHGYREVARDPLRGVPPPPHGDHGTGYPYPVALRDGSLLFTTGQGVGRVMVMRLDPDWLLETEQSDYFEGFDVPWSFFGSRGAVIGSYPGKEPRRVLRVARIDPAFPACAVRNIPCGATGTLRMRFHLDLDAGAFRVGLADHFSPPFDAEDRFHNLCNVTLDGVAPGWHTLALSWDMAKRRCRATLDGKAYAVAPLRHESAGPCYLRLKALADGPTAAGIMVESVNVKISRCIP